MADVMEKRADIGFTHRVDEQLVPASTRDSEQEKDEQVNLTLLESFKKWRLVVYYCLGMSTALLMYGFDTVIIGSVAAMPSFQQDFGKKYDGKLILPGVWLSVWACASPIFGIPGAIIAGSFSDRHGRRACIILGTVLCCLGVAVCFASNLPDEINSRRGMYLAGKSFQGLAIGMVASTVQTYMSEILPTSLRGPILAFFPIAMLLGQLIGAVVIYACLELHEGYRICFASQWAFSAVPMIVAFLAPESPTWLIRKGRHDDALKAQKRLDGKGIPTEAALARIKLNIESEKLQTQATYMDCFRRMHIRRTMIVVLASCLPQLFGLALLAKASYFVQVVGMEAGASLLVLILGLVLGLISNIASIWVLSRVGRRKLVLVSLSVLIVLWLGVGICGIWDGNVVVWYTTATMMAVVITAGLGVWPASYAIGSEASALHLRAKAQGIAWATVGLTGALFGFIVPLIFNPDAGALGAKTGFVYAGCCLVALVLSFQYVPEMKGRTAAEIDAMFDQKLPARRFKSWTAGSNSHTA